MKIRTKLLLSLSTLPILLIILILIGVNQFTSINKMSEKIRTNYEISILVEQIQRDIKDEGIRLRNLVIYQDQDILKEELVLLQGETESIQQNIASLDKRITDESQRDSLTRLIETNSEFNNYKDNVVDLVFNGKKNEALLLMNETSVDIHNQFFDVVREMTTIFETDMEGVLDSFSRDFQREIIISVVVLGVVILLIMGLLFRSIWSVSTRLKTMSDIMREVATGNTDLLTKVEVTSSDEIGDVANSFNLMSESLDTQMQKEQSQTWIKTNIADITTTLSGSKDLKALSQTFLSKVVPLVESSHAVFYVKDEDENQKESTFKLLASYAFKERKHITNTVRLGEGLIGQAAFEKTPIILTDVPSDYISIKSGLGEGTPLNLYILPIIFEGDVKAVLEIASFKQYTETQQTFIEDLINDIGIILESVMGRIRLAQLLEESQVLMEEVQAQSEELQNQQEELRATNEELEEQTQALRQSEEKLQMQQEELEQTNADLEEKAKNLEEQNKKFERTNREVEKARAELEEKAKQLALSSKYKSEFLANMSHELRTPLNSLLILSKLLSDNMDGNLTEKQVEYSKTIYSSGNDLLALINEILDLAKIESGKMEVNLSHANLMDIASFVNNSFKEIANQKKVKFNIQLNEDVPDTIYSDEVRIQQILKNLLSNAFKFTEHGEVNLNIGVHSKVNDKTLLSFTVRDTGIGIAKDKQKLIFEAFQQADGTTSRKFGGTGLGLSISREIASLLGGKIEVESVEGKGSTFTFIVGDYDGEQKHVQSTTSFNEVAVTKEHQIPVPIQPKKVPIHPEVLEEQEDNNQIKRLLIVDDDKRQRNSLMELIGDMDFVIKAVSTGYEAMEELKVSHFDCLILDLGLTDTSGFELLEKIALNDKNNNLKVFVYTGRHLTSKEEIQLNRHAHTIIIKDEHSPERLVDELQLFLNESNAKTESNKQSNTQIENTSGLVGKKILLVDDDVRNVYALSSILELFGMEVLFAENGIEGIELLQKTPYIDLVLMDIMMPEMDGYEAIQRIREMPKFAYLPVIALTAKAMKEDRDKCMEVGASDYIVKPVDPDQLISLLKVWLYEEGRT